MFHRSNSKPRKLKVLIVGGGAAGMSCADTLAKEPEKFDVTLLERNPEPGGQAKSIAIDSQKFGADWVNIGSQGGPGVFRHMFKFFREYGYEPKEIPVQLSLGKGENNFWTNVFPTHLMQRHTEEIGKFGRKLCLIQQIPILWPVPLKVFLRLFNFSEEFCTKIVFPISALFFGIGNQGKNIPCGLFQALFQEPSRKMWDYDPETFVPYLPKTYAFPNMSSFFRDWATGLRSKGAKIRLNTQVLKVVKRDNEGIVVETRLTDADPRISADGYEERNVTERFDKLVICIAGTEAKRLLGKTASRRERYVLGKAQFFDDLTITHTDHTYFRRKYETNFKEECCAAPKSKEEEDRIKFAKGEAGPESGFRPSHCTFSYRSQGDKVEAACDFTNFQFQFRDLPQPLPFEQHIFRSHFMDEKLKDIWTIDLIDENSILDRQWWHQLSNRWQHFIRLVPAMRFLNGRNNTVYAGAWTFTSVLELACVSGITAAYTLGAKYDKVDDVAEELFTFYMRVSHGKKYKRK